MKAVLEPGLRVKMLSTWGSVKSGDVGTVKTSFYIGLDGRDSVSVDVDSGPIHLRVWCNDIEIIN